MLCFRASCRRGNATAALALLRMQVDDERKRDEFIPLIAEGRSIRQDRLFSFFSYVLCAVVKTNTAYFFMKTEQEQILNSVAAKGGSRAYPLRLCFPQAAGSGVGG